MARTLYVSLIGGVVGALCGGVAYCLSITSPLGIATAGFLGGLAIEWFVLDRAKPRVVDDDPEHAGDADATSAEVPDS